MSAGSFDESSNLVVTSPSSNDKEQSFHHLSPEQNSEASDLHEKSSKGTFHFIKKRAKSPFRSPLKSPIKSPLKSPFKSAKSSSKHKHDKSPTKEVLADGVDVGEIEKKISEKKTEEWQVFQQMQERIKQNVLKTQTSLSKLSSSQDSPESNDNNGVEKRQKLDDTFWSSFDDTSSLIPQGQGHGVQVKEKHKPGHQKHAESTPKFERIEDLCESADLLDLAPQQNISFLQVNPTPGPPANSLRASMENLTSEENTDNFTKQDAVADLLGLSNDHENANVIDTHPPAEQIMNQDLLGLDNLVSCADSQPGSSMASSFDGSDMVYGTSQSERSSQRSTPLGFEQNYWEQDQTVPTGSTLTSTFVSSMVDEFLQLDTMKDVTEQSLNPFDSSSKITKSSTLDSLDPYSSKTAPETYSPKTKPAPPPPVPVAVPVQTNESTGPILDADAFGVCIKPSLDTCNNMSTTVTSEFQDYGMPTGDTFDDFDGNFEKLKADADEGGEISKPAQVYDNLGFGLADNQKHKNCLSDNTFELNTDISDTKSIINPFLDAISEAETSVSSGVIKTSTAALFDENIFENTSNTTVNQDAFADIWGVPASEPADSSAQQSSNPFQDDFFTVDQIPVNTAAFTECDTVVSGKNNPFLEETSTFASPPIANVNPFLDLNSSVVQTAKPDIADVDNFLFGAKGETANQESLKSPTLSDFDPFGVSTKKNENEAAPVAATSVTGETDIFTSVATSGDDQLVFPEDEDDKMFMLEIKPKMLSADEAKFSKEPPPALKPPPRPPRSPQPPRENPFNKDSPPEENFAKFEIRGEERDSDYTLPSFSSESNTPEEELAAMSPLEPYIPKSEKEGWSLMLRQPTKKKLTANRFWKQVYVKIAIQNDGPVLKLYHDANDADTFQELPLQPCYSVSDVALQQYDQYGKIYVIKVQYIFYRERVGLRPDRITPSFVKKPKATMILDHAPQVSEMLKFGSLDRDEIDSFVIEVENALMNMEAHREKTLTYVKDEVCAEVWDEYTALLDKEGKVITQKARVRAFFLAFVTGMPTCEIGFNDKRRRGKEVVGRHDIIPIKTEEWIRLEDVTFHCCVDQKEFLKSNNIRFHPLDACQFELLRYRVRLRENKELPLQLKIQQTLKENKVELRCDLLVTGYHSFSKKHGQFPCEDIEVRFPIPDAWIYLFRYERRFGYGSIKSAMRKPGKIKGLERLTMIAQGLLTPTLMETDVGVAKYENLYKAVVWRIPRLPERNEGAYTSHLFRLTLEFGPHDEIPQSFEKFAHVNFTMPSCTVSQTQVRSITVENPNPPDKWVRYLAKYSYKIEINHFSEIPEKDSTENSE